MSAQSLTDQEIQQEFGSYPGYRGWGLAEARADWNATQGVGKSGSFGGGSSSGASSSNLFNTSDPIAMARQLNEFNVQQNQPAIQSLQQQIPEVQSAYSQERARLQGQVTPLTERYRNLLDEIKNTYNQAVKTTQISESRELGRRGIVGGGLYDETIQEAVNPLVQQQATSLKDVTYAQEGAIGDINAQIAQLVGAETSDLRSVSNAIAALQSGNASNAIQGALNLLQMQQSNQQFIQSQSQQAGQFEASLAEQKSEFAAEQSRLSSNAGQQTQTEKTQITAQQLSNDLSRGITYRDAHNKYDATLGVATVNDMYNSGSIYGPAKETQKQTMSLAEWISYYKSQGYSDVTARDFAAEAYNKSL